MAKDWYSTQEAANLCGMSIHTIRDYIKKGAFRGKRVGRQWRISKEDVDQFVGNATPPGTPTPLKGESTETTDTVFTTSQSEDEFQQILAEFGESEDSITVSVERISPEEPPYGGYLETYNYPPRPSEIKSKYGGGTYRFTIIGADGRRKFLQKKISGAPKNPEIKDEDTDEEEFIRPHNGRFRGRSRFPRDDAPPTKETPLTDIMTILHESSSRNQEQMTQLIQYQQMQREQERKEDRERADRERREREERWERDRMMREEEHRRSIERINAQAELERQREEARADRERKRDDDNMKFMTLLNEKREAAATEARSKIEEFHGKTIEHTNDLMQLKINMIDRESEKERQRLEEIRELLTEKGVKESTIAEVMKSVAEGLGKFADKYVSGKQQVAQQQQGVMTRLPNAPVPQQIEQQQQARLSGPEESPTVLPQSTQGEMSREDREKAAREAQAQFTRTSNGQPTPQADLQGREINVALLDKLNNEAVSDMLEMMASHVQNKIPPTMMADLLMRTMEEQIEMQFVVMVALGTNVNTLVSIFPNFPESAKLALTSSEGNTYFEELKKIVSENFHDNPDDDDSSDDNKIPISETAGVTGEEGIQGDQS